MAKYTDLNAEIHGINQSSSIDETLEVARKYLKIGCDVQIKIQEFGEGSKEHAPLEYEVWAWLNDNDWNKIVKDNMEE